MTTFRRTVLKSQLQITLHELERAGARNVACLERPGGLVEVTAEIPNAPSPKVGGLRFGGRKRSGESEGRQ